MTHIELSYPREAVVDPSVGTDGLNLRQAPDAESVVLAALPVGQRVAITDQATNGDTEWYRVWTRLDNGQERVGWVAARFLILT